MASVTHAVATASTTDGSSFTSGAFTPAMDDLLIVLIAASDTVEATGGQTLTSSATRMSFTKVNGTAYSTSANLVELWVANNLVTDTASQTVTWGCPSDAATGCVIAVARVSGMARCGANAIRQSAVTANGAAGGTPGTTFTAAALTGNVTIGVVGNSTNPATVTEPSGWTEAVDTGYATPTTGLEYVYRNSGSTATAITWGNKSSASVFGVVSAELDTTTPTAPVSALMAPPIPAPAPFELVP